MSFPSRSPTSPSSASGFAAATLTSGLRLPAAVKPPSEDNPPKKAVWIVFGATGHVGRSLVRAALNHGDVVTAVGKIHESSQESMNGWHENCFGSLCDVRIKSSVAEVIEKTIDQWGKIDIIANCTGYGVIAAAEDQTAFDLENQFATNFMGTLHILQAALPYFRQNRIAGRFLILSSTAGALGVPGLAPYCATKYAVEGLIESMLYETHAFGIKATLVEPGHLRDDVEGDVGSPTHLGGTAAGSSPDDHRSGISAGTGGPMERIKRYGHFSVKPNPSEPYNHPNAPSGHAKRVFQWINTRQPTSAARSAELVWQLGHCAYPPLRLLLGSIAVDSIRDRLKCITEEIEDWKHLNFVEGVPIEATKDANKRSKTGSSGKDLQRRFDNDEEEDDAHQEEDEDDDDQSGHEDYDHDDYHMASGSEDSEGDDDHGDDSHNEHYDDEGSDMDHESE